MAVRFYVLHPNQDPQGRPYIAGVAVQDQTSLKDIMERGLERTALEANYLAQKSSTILTREELLATEEGARALKAWEAGVDDEVDREGRRIKRLVDEEELRWPGR